MYITNLKNVIVQWQRSKARGSVMLQEYQGFHIFFEIVLLFFDFLVTGGTLTTKLGPKYLEKNLKKCSVSIVLLFRSGAGYEAHWQIML